MKENRFSTVSCSCLWFLHFVSVKASGEKGYPWKRDFIFSRQKLLNMYFLMCIWIFSPICTVFITKPPFETGYGVCVSTCLDAFFVCYDCSWVCVIMW